jgi:hypothetical protein
MVIMMMMMIENRGVDAFRAPSNELVESCSRKRSRMARDVISSYILPVVEEEMGQFSPSCPFNPTLDVVAEQESNKREMRKNQWKCTLCDKTFVDEPYLDKHMERVHSLNLSSDDSRWVCLADYCDILHCNVLSKEKDPSSAVGGGGVCRPEQMQMQQFRCKAIFHKCFPRSEGATSSYINDLYISTFCRVLSCEFYGREDLLRDAINKEITPTVVAALSDKAEVQPGTVLYWVLVGISFVSFFLSLPLPLSLSLTLLFC